MKYLPTESYQARDGEELFFRYYPAQSNKVMILLHGISEDSKYLLPLATFVSKENLAHVYTPDLRGHGEQPRIRGDINYIGQHEDDLFDLITVIREKHYNAAIIIAGHSAGGGTALRFASSKYKRAFDALLLLAPFIHPSAPTIRKSNENSNGEAYISRLVTLFLLNSIRIRTFNHWIVYTSHKPEEDRHGTETPEISFRLFISRYPNNYKKALRAIKDPTLVIVGEDDEEFNGQEFEPLFRQTRADTKIVASATHDGILSNQETYSLLKEWFSRVN
ncbi:alpha/beta hydrolase [Desertibacillus haloalkaliphilus]|uniref:alpha/beta hydrolase n=1 Tax=Desertibacillus haloalkaliphilus TaxID=1328930 RepID=UPI001C27920A|nr:alpha/beta fold hydrolase [Desertibacillus haloalkaliphilus]MBU8907895.1 lysophospholipase [Desertibacillus haloalkaliphilus]